VGQLGHPANDPWLTVPPPLLPLLPVGVHMREESTLDPLPVPELLVTPDDETPLDEPVLPLPDELPLLPLPLPLAPLAEPLPAPLESLVAALPSSLPPSDAPIVCTLPLHAATVTIASTTPGAHTPSLMAPPSGEESSVRIHGVIAITLRLQATNPQGDRLIPQGAPAWLEWNVRRITAHIC
jgi:hypothetical protein